MKISPAISVNHRYESRAKREIADALRAVNDACDAHLRSTGCPMDSALARLEGQQRAAEAALDNICQAYRDAGRDLPPTFMALVRHRDSAAQKLRTLRTLQPLRWANFDALDRAGTPQERP